MKINKISFSIIGVKAIIYRITSMLIFSYFLGFKLAILTGTIAFIWYCIYDCLFHLFFNVKKQKG